MLRLHYDGLVDRVGKHLAALLVVELALFGLGAKEGLELFELVRREQLVQGGPCVLLQATLVFQHARVLHFWKLLPRGLVLAKDWLGWLVVGARLFIALAWVYLA